MSKDFTKGMGMPAAASLPALANGNIESVTHDIALKYNPVTQSVGLEFDPTKFKSFEFVLGILEMAKVWTELMRMQAMQAQAQQEMQRMMMAQQQEAVLRGGIARGR